jgi:hypothetical protein
VEACEPLTETVGLWHGHRTRLVDGTGVSLPDTPELQRAFGKRIANTIPIAQSER